MRAEARVIVTEGACGVSRRKGVAVPPLLGGIGTIPFIAGRTRRPTWSLITCASGRLCSCLDL